MKLLQLFADLKLVNDYLKFAIYSLFIFFASEFLISESYRIHTIISGDFIFRNLPEVFTYTNYISVVSFILMYAVIRNYTQVPNDDKEQYLISFIAIIFILNYVMKFYFFERLFSLKSIGLYVIPNSASDFLPFDWYYLSSGYTDFQSDFDPGWYKLQFIFSLISAISILLAIYFSVKFIRTSKVKPEIKNYLLAVKNQFVSTQSRIMFLSVVVIFFIFGIQNVKANDYRSISYEAEFMQDDLVKFQEELKLANEISFQPDKYDARKAAANKVYSSISSNDEELNDLNLSLWSSDLKDLKFGVVEWIVLWEKFLKEMSLQGYVEAGTLFDLNQKYAEVAKLGKFSAPDLVAEWSIEFWDKEFIALVN